MKRIVCLVLSFICLLSLLVSCECQHVFGDGACTKCGEPCAHTFEEGVCAVCQQACVHSYDKGICTGCGEKDLKFRDLTGRKFEFAYFELSWSEGVSESKKETLRRRYNAETDKELFDTLHKQYNSLLSLVGSFFAEEYEFFADISNGASVNVKSDIGKVVYKYKITQNNIVINGDTFYYEKDHIYRQGDSEDIVGIAIKEVYMEYAEE